jgi:hypothetical protein
MECEQSYFSLCTMLPVALGILGFLKMDTLLDLAVTGVGVGKLKKTKQQLRVETTEGNIKLPTVKMPCLEWEVYFLNEDIETEDGYHILSVVDGVNKTRCPQFRDLLICEHIYAKDYGRGDLRCVIESPFDDVCYLFSIHRDEMINYSSMIETFLKCIEEN